MEIKEITANPDLTGQVRLIENVTYAAVDGEALKLSLLVPWLQRYRVNELKRRPLLVFVQGSSWQRPTLGEEIPQLVRYVHQGMVVATVQHRNSLEGHPFPAFLADVKTAIRFLRVHAAEYAIDPERVVLWGTSSGGNAALLAGLTGDDKRYRTAAYPEESDAVNAVIACFAPTDVEDVFNYTSQVPGSDLLQYCLFGKDQKQWAELKREMSPLYQIKAGQAYPPFLLFHGDADRVVPYHQMEDMAHALADAGVDVTAVRVKGAGHETNFWSPAVYDLASDFIQGQVHPSKTEK